MVDLNTFLNVFQEETFNRPIEQKVISVKMYADWTRSFKGV